MNAHERANEMETDAVCDRCGKLGAFRMGDRLICMECYAICGSCCLEFGDDDLWQKTEDEDFRKEVAE